MTRLGLFVEIARERERQDAAWGEQNHDAAGWFAILGEEFGEVARATVGIMFECGTDDPHELIAALREELIQVAAVAVSWVEAIDRRP